MSVPIAAANAAKSVSQIAARYSPEIARKAQELLTKATGGKVTSPGDLAKFVGASASKLSVVTNAVAAAGVSPDDVLPTDLLGNNAQLREIRASIEATALALRGRFDAGADRTIESSPEDTAKDVLRKQRVEAVLAVYGSAERYFLCHPNGGIPRSDFSWYKAMRFPLAARL